MLINKWLIQNLEIMTKTWIVIGTVLLFFVLEKEISFLDLKGREKATIMVVLYDEPTLKSNAEKHSFTSSKLLVNYEYCNFYSVVVKLLSGVRVNKYLYKKSEEIAQLGLKISTTRDFKKKNCNGSNSSQEIIRSINPSYPDVKIEGLEYLKNKYNRAVAPPREKKEYNPFNTGVIIEGLGRPKYPVAPPRTRPKSTVLDKERGDFDGS